MSTTKRKKHSGGVFQLNYHLVWCTKYRRQYLVSLIAEDTKVLLAQKAAELGISIEVMEVMPDHVHVFISSKPTLSPHIIVRRLKGATSAILRQRYPQLQRSNSLWTSSYYAGSVGVASESVIRNYIESQKGK
jgi:putative transposase